MTHSPSGDHSRHHSALPLPLSFVFGLSFIGVLLFVLLVSARLGRSLLGVLLENHICESESCDREQAKGRGDNAASSSKQQSV